MNHVLRSVELQPSPALSDFKSAMRGVAGAVSVVTVGNGPTINGMTVTSVTSFSVEPPTMLVSINQSASSYALLKRSGVFGISILGSRHQDVAERFSGKDGLKGAARFAGAEWIQLVTGVPLLAGAAAAFDCTVDDVIERHSHAAVIGRVCGLRVTDNVGAIVYRHGTYVPVRSQADIEMSESHLFY